ncbi:hypothetical protein DL95DRAFT_391971 [Leptodontidium sp. 2 PMI_412]|nr:hypothetical protein DL95DRAFT_391971 [Leptodontidium sp. 2 PMI_412]
MGCHCFDLPGPFRFTSFCFNWSLLLLTRRMSLMRFDRDGGAESLFGKLPKGGSVREKR